MKKFFTPIFLSLISIFALFSATTCKNNDFYRWIETSEGLQYQNTTGTVTYNYELRQGDLQVYAVIDGGEIRLQFFDQNKWFDKRKAYIYLVNKEPVEIVEGDVAVTPDSFKLQWGVNSSKIWNAKVGDSSLSKVSTDDSILCISGEPAFLIRHFLINPESRGKVSITFQDGGTKYEFKLYSEGLK